MEDWSPTSCIIIFLSVFYLGRIVVNKITNNIKLKQRSKLNSNNPRDINIINKLKQDINLINPGKIFTIELGINQMILDKSHIIINLKKENGEYLEYNEILNNFINMYSSTLCKSMGHTNEWLKIYKDLLSKAEKLQLYKSPNK